MHIYENKLKEIEKKLPEEAELKYEIMYLPCLAEGGLCSANQV